MHAVIPYVIAALLFGLGVYGVLRRRNAILVLMAVELMLNAVNLVFITANATLPKTEPTGQIFALFVIVIAADEAAVALAIVLNFYNNHMTVDVDTAEELKG